jgi:very-short-patch-repair endonuclease
MIIQLKNKSLVLEDLQKYYDEGHSVAATAKEFGISSRTLMRLKASHGFVTRDKSAALVVSNAKYPRTFSEAQRGVLRTHMERRLANGTYPTLGRSNRKIGKPSYPETFFKEVIENEFTDKRYEAEHPFGSFSLDFAWLHLKKCIEIDGEQHFASQEAIDRDCRKDAFLATNGWKVFRIRWKDFYKDPKPLILLVKQFIEE